MKIFISWSGELSKAVAGHLQRWLKCTLQGSTPWLSTKDIERGAQWFGEINAQLQDTTTGIICLTHENKNKPWILFEAGALAKGLTTSRVCTFLIDLEPKDLEDPLAQMNHTFPKKESLKELFMMLNGRCAKPLEFDVLEQVFEGSWLQFEKNFNEALNTHPATPAEKRPPEPQVLLERIYEATISIREGISKLNEHSAPPAARQKSTFSNLQADNMYQRFIARFRAEVISLLRNGHSSEFVIEHLKDTAWIPETTARRVVNEIMSEMDEDMRDLPLGS